VECGKQDAFGLVAGVAQLREGRRRVSEGPPLEVRVDYQAFATTRAPFRGRTFLS
jgi:hypothetical protein